MTHYLGTLAVECEQKELWQYAGLCYLAAARCHGTLKNASSEINLLIKAGRQFLTAEKKNNDIGCPSLGQENMLVNSQYINVLIVIYILSYTHNKIYFRLLLAVSVIPHCVAVIK